MADCIYGENEAVNSEHSIQNCVLTETQCPLPLFQLPIKQWNLFRVFLYLGNQF